MPDVQTKVHNDLIEVADGLVEQKKTINELLSDEIHGTIRVFIESRLNQIINRINFITGRSQSETVTRSSVLSPITDFMGEEMKKVKEVTPEILGPTEQRKKIYLEKLKQLQADFPTLSNEEVLDAYPSDEDKLVLRGLAKRAAVPEYKEGEINSEFLEKIRNGLKEIQMADEKKDATELKIANTDDDDNEDEDLVK